MSLVERAKNILLQPKTEWPVIASEQATTGSLYTGYIIPLALIGPVATVIGWSVFGYPVLGLGAIRSPLGIGLRTAVVVYVFSLVYVFLVAVVIDALAPTFGGQKNQIQALKVATYSLTAVWVGGIVNLFPSIALLVLLAALYSCFLLFLGLPVLMKAPEDKAPIYAAVVIVAAIVLYFVIGAIVGQVAYRPGMGM